MKVGETFRTREGKTAYCLAAFPDDDIALPYLIVAPHNGVLEVYAVDIEGRSSPKNGLRVDQPTDLRFWTFRENPKEGEP